MAEMIAGGYILIRPEPVPDNLSKYNLMPEKYFSASSCHSTSSGIAEWAGGNPELLGVLGDKLDLANKWAGTAHEDLFGYPNVFYTLHNARDYVAAFIPEIPDDLTILCLALPDNLVKELLAKEVAKYGVYQTLERMEQPAEGGTIIGYEILSFGYGIEHTWLCYGFHDETYEKHNIKPNIHGFLDNESDAQLIIDSIVRIPPNTKDELWYPFQIIQYDVKSS